MLISCFFLMNGRDFMLEVMHILEEEFIKLIMLVTTMIIFFLLYDVSRIVQINFTRIFVLTILFI